MLVNLTDLFALPLSLEQVKAQLRLDHGDEDQLLIQYIKSGVAWIESHLGKCLMTQSWQQTWKKSGSRRFVLARGPIQELRSLFLITPTGERQPLKAEKQTESEGFLTINLKYPLVEGHQLEAFYSAGYGSRPDDIPADIRQALLLYVTCLYEHRSTVDRSAVLAICDLLNSHRRLRLS